MIVNGEVVLLERAKNMLTISELAKKAKVGRSTISKIETGKSVGSPVVIAKLANALEIDVEQLLRK